MLENLAMFAAGMICGVVVWVIAWRRGYSEGLDDGYGQAVEEDNRRTPPPWTDQGVRW